MSAQRFSRIVTLGLHLAIGTVVYTLGLAAQVSTPVVMSGTTSEALLRKSALTMVRPAYPEADRKAATTGVVVAAVTLTESGIVRRIKVLEAPSPSMATSVSEAVTNWHFKPWPPIEGRPVSISAKLTFYFVRDRRQYSVLNPSEAGYVGRWRVSPSP
jgi:TonB family protein